MASLVESCCSRDSLELGGDFTWDTKVEAPPDLSPMRLRSQTGKTIELASALTAALVLLFVLARCAGFLVRVDAADGGIGLRHLADRSRPCAASPLDPETSAAAAEGTLSNTEAERPSKQGREEPYAVVLEEPDFPPFADGDALEYGDDTQDPEPGARAFFEEREASSDEIHSGGDSGEDSAAVVGRALRDVYKLAEVHDLPSHGGLPLLRAIQENVRAVLQYTAALNSEERTRLFERSRFVSRCVKVLVATNQRLTGWQRTMASYSYCLHYEVEFTKSCLDDITARMQTGDFSGISCEEGERLLKEGLENMHELSARLVFDVKWRCHFTMRVSHHSLRLLDKDRSFLSKLKMTRAAFKGDFLGSSLANIVGLLAITAADLATSESGILVRDLVTETLRLLTWEVQLSSRYNPSLSSPNFAASMVSSLSGLAQVLRRREIAKVTELEELFFVVMHPTLETATGLGTLEQLVSGSSRAVDRVRGCLRVLRRSLEKGNTLEVGKSMVQRVREIAAERRDQTEEALQRVGLHPQPHPPSVQACVDWNRMQRRWLEGQAAALRDLDSQTSETEAAALSEQGDQSLAPGESLEDRVGKLRVSEREGKDSASPVESRKAEAWSLTSSSGGRAAADFGREMVFMPLTGLPRSVPESWTAPRLEFHKRVIQAQLEELAEVNDAQAPFPSVEQRHEWLRQEVQRLIMPVVTTQSTRRALLEGLRSSASLSFRTKVQRRREDIKDAPSEAGERRLGLLGLHGRAQPPARSGSAFEDVFNKIIRFSLEEESRAEAATDVAPLPSRRRRDFSTRLRPPASTDAFDKPAAEGSCSSPPSDLTSEVRAKAWADKFDRWHTAAKVGMARQPLFSVLGARPKERRREQQDAAASGGGGVASASTVVAFGDAETGVGLARREAATDAPSRGSRAESLPPRLRPRVSESSRRASADSGERWSGSEERGATGQESEVGFRSFGDWGEEETADVLSRQERTALADDDHDFLEPTEAQMLALERRIADGNLAEMVRDQLLDVVYAVDQLADPVDSPRSKCRLRLRCIRMLMNISLDMMEFADDKTAMQIFQNGELVYQADKMLSSALAKLSVWPSLATVYQECIMLKLQRTQLRVFDLKHSLVTAVISRTPSRNRLMRCMLRLHLARLRGGELVPVNPRLTPVKNVFMASVGVDDGFGMSQCCYRAVVVAAVFLECIRCFKSLTFTALQTGQIRFISDLAPWMLSFLTDELALAGRFNSRLSSPAFVAPAICMVGELFNVLRKRGLEAEVQMLFHVLMHPSLEVTALAEELDRAVLSQADVLVRVIRDLQSVTFQIMGNPTHSRLRRLLARMTNTVTARSVQRVRTYAQLRLEMQPGPPSREACAAWNTMQRGWIRNQQRGMQYYASEIGLRREQQPLSSFLSEFLQDGNNWESRGEEARQGGVSSGFGERVEDFQVDTDLTFQAVALPLRNVPALWDAARLEYHRRIVDAQSREIAGLMDFEGVYPSMEQRHLWLHRELQRILMPVVSSIRSPASGSARRPLSNLTFRIRGDVRRRRRDFGTQHYR